MWGWGGDGSGTKRPRFFFPGDERRLAAAGELLEAVLRGVVRGPGLSGHPVLWELLPLLIPSLPGAVVPGNPGAARDADGLPRAHDPRSSSRSSTSESRRGSLVSIVWDTILSYSLNRAAVPGSSRRSLAHQAVFRVADERHVPGDGEDEGASVRGPLRPHTAAPVLSRCPQRTPGPSSGRSRSPDPL